MLLRLLALVALPLLLAGTSQAETQQQKTADKKYRIGLSVWSGYPDSVRGFKESLQQAGLIEGQQVEYLYRNAQTDEKKQRAIAAEFASLNVDMVYSLTTPGTLIIKDQLPESTPIIFSIVTYPADAGLIESFDYSGNNLVGTSNYVPLKNYVKLLKKLLPDTKTAAIFHKLGEPNSKIQAAGLIRLLKRAGIKARSQQPRSLDELETMANKISHEVDVFITTTDTLMQNGGEQRLIDISLKTGTPILSSNKQGIKDGSSFGPVADFYTLGKLSGKMAVSVITEDTPPSNMASRLQDPPLMLVNRSSFKTLNIELPAKLSGVQYVD